MFDDLTIAFSGHNIKWFAVLAIESFLLYYPDLRSRIVYFDDESTDGTKEELESRGIKIITWIPELKKEFIDYIKDDNLSLTIRCSYIYMCMLNQINTKYAFISDGDVVFKSGGFLEDHFQKIKEGFQVITIESYHLFQGDSIQRLKANPKKYSNIISYISEKKEVVKQWFGKNSVIEREVEGMIQRMNFLHTLLDLEFLKNNEIIGDNINETPLPQEGFYLDTGTSMYCICMKKGIRVFCPQNLDDIFYHWTWISSAVRQKQKNTFINFEEDMKSAIYDTELEEILRKVNIHPMKIIQTFKKMRGID